MSWHPIDFQGIIDLNPKIVEQLEQFLQEKENRLAYQLSNVIQSISSEIDAPILTLPSGSGLKLSEAVESFGKQVRLFVKKQSILEGPKDKGKRVVQEINQGLWEFAEILEGCVVELFQQVKQVTVDRWHLSISQVVNAIKDILIHRIDDLIWLIRRLEKPLKEYCLKCHVKENKWFDWYSFRETYIDPQLLRNLQQSEKYLKTHFDHFNQIFKEYMQLNVKVEDNLEQMKKHPILALMDVSDQNLYVDVFRLLKMLQLNQYPKKKLAIDTNRSLKHLTSIDHILRVFRIYYLELEEAFFKSSLEWKSLDPEGENFMEGQQKLQDKVKDYQQELRQLLETMGHYRTFMLKNDSNPYIRSRWGFTEWIVGPEPPKAKKLLNRIYLAQELDANFTEFATALASDTSKRHRLEYHAHQVIEKLLHEMGQPLISRSMMRNRAADLLDQLKACDEIGSPNMSTVYYVEDVLSKAMREDWKYHVLHELPLFHKIYNLHEGMVEGFEDPSHAFRLDRFRILFDQIEGWVKKEDVYGHVQEIELDINDMKSYLQDFLATIQRVVKDKTQDPFLDETIHKFRQQLLEYRYLFGQFFLSIEAKNRDGFQLRNQFLFVDQYFESVENLLNELKIAWEGKH
jgi:hypothetical protein